MASTRVKCPSLAHGGVALASCNNKPCTLCSNVYICKSVGTVYIHIWHLACKLILTISFDQLELAKNINSFGSLSFSLGQRQQLNMPPFVRPMLPSVFFFLPHPFGCAVEGYL